MHPNAKLVEDFYISFQRKDADAMVSCYHPDVVFSDPVFVDLRGPRAGGMWRMLTKRAEDFSLTFRDIHGDDQRGSAHWEASYLFSETGRRVHNVIEATFEFRDGKIVRHEDRFDLWRWSAQALGARGRILGWLPPVKKAIRAKAEKSLDRFLAS